MAFIPNLAAFTSLVLYANRVAAAYVAAAEVMDVAMTTVQKAAANGQVGDEELARTSSRILQGSLLLDKLNKMYDNVRAIEASCAEELDLDNCERTNQGLRLVNQSAELADRVLAEIKNWIAS